MSLLRLFVWVAALSWCTLAAQAEDVKFAGPEFKGAPVMLTG